MDAPAHAHEPWRSFLRSMGRVSAHSFGGPIAQIGVMHQEAVERRKWVSEAEFLRLLDFANLLPGPEALELAIHLGALRRGLAGGIVAGLLFIAPGFASLTLLAWIYVRWGDVPALAAVLDGIRPVATALIAAAAVRLSTRSMSGAGSYALIALAFAASFGGGAPFPLVLIGCGAIGAALARHRAIATVAGHEPKSTRSEGWAVAIVVAALAIGWLAGPPRDHAITRAIVAEGAEMGASRLDRLPAVALVNTKAALLTFGGAYTALPLLREETVVRHGWLPDAAMIDALALGETTPGPLICVAVFLSFLAAGFPGAVVGAVFLFLPSFVLVLGLGRHMSRVERIPRARDFLWGVSAATVGLILALSAQVVPRSLDAPLAAAIAAVAFIAVWRFKVNVIAAVAAGGVLGLLLHVLA